LNVPRWCSAACSPAIKRTRQREPRWLVCCVCHAAVVVASEWDGGDWIRVTRELEGSLRHEIRVPLPAVM
jgi:hypothetical protein